MTDRSVPMGTATCGIEFTPSTTSDNLTPQETTEEESGTVGADRTGLPCPGSSAVADCDQKLSDSGVEGGEGG